MALALFSLSTFHPRPLAPFAHTRPTPSWVPHCVWITICKIVDRAINICLRRPSVRLIPSRGGETEPKPHRKTMAHITFNIKYRCANKHKTILIFHLFSYSHSHAPAFFFYLPFLLSASFVQSLASFPFTQWFSYSNAQRLFLFLSFSNIHFQTITLSSSSSSSARNEFATQNSDELQSQRELVVCFLFLFFFALCNLRLSATKSHRKNALNIYHNRLFRAAEQSENQAWRTHI